MKPEAYRITQGLVSMCRGGVCCGCYTKRCKHRQASRELVQLIRAAQELVRPLEAEALPLCVQSLTSRALGADLHPAARFGKGVFIAHPLGAARWLPMSLRLTACQAPRVHLQIPHAGDVHLPHFSHVTFVSLGMTVLCQRF